MNCCRPFFVAAQSLAAGFRKRRDEVPEILVGQPVIERENDQSTEKHDGHEDSHGPYATRNAIVVDTFQCWI